LKIFGLNIASSAANKNGRGWINLETREFVYLPIEEDMELEQPAPTYRELGFSDVAYPHLPVHLDPEFETFTYGHRKRFGDARLWKMEQGDILFFYATLDLLPERKTWGVYVIGYFTIDHVQDTRGLTPEQIKSLKEFENNAHMKRINPRVDLLVKGLSNSKLYKQAIQLSHPEDTRRLHPTLANLLTTVTGKPVSGAGWHRWLLYSEREMLFTLLRDNS
jgi:hypothetical protein